MPCKNCPAPATKHCPCGNRFCDACWMPEDNLCHECIEMANESQNHAMRFLEAKSQRLDEVVAWVEELFDYYLDDNAIVILDAVLAKAKGGSDE